jgi:hypothetical protein
MNTENIIKLKKEVQKIAIYDLKAIYKKEPGGVSDHLIRETSGVLLGLGFGGLTDESTRSLMDVVYDCRKTLDVLEIPDPKLIKEMGAFIAEVFADLLISEELKKEGILLMPQARPSEVYSSLMAS